MINEEKYIKVNIILDRELHKQLQEYVKASGDPKMSVSRAVRELVSLSLPIDGSLWPDSGVTEAKEEIKNCKHGKISGINWCIGCLGIAK